MRTMQFVRAGCLIGAFGACMLTAGQARADVTTERPGSILIFPKVVNAAGRDTVIQVTNTGNSVNQLRCFYIDGRKAPSGRPVCAVTDFNVTLTKQQPTHWRVGTGRAVNPNDGIPGFDPGIIPPVSTGFTGGLVCVEVGDDNVPVVKNKLKGEATLEGPAADVSKYSALAVQGNAAPGANDGNNVLSLGGGTPEYNACPTAAQFNFIPDGAVDPIIETLGNGGGNSAVFSTLTALPCNLDLQTQIAQKFTLGYLVIDGDEIKNTGSSGPLSCWAQINLADLSQAVVQPAGSLKGPVATIRVTSVAGGPVLLVGESFHVDAAGNVGAAAVNLHTMGLCKDPAASAVDREQPCQRHADCPQGPPAWSCVLNQSATIKLPTAP